ncbi:hypothetical protein ENBRE01_0629 [Enteropsectra breve]|nr:hypothetical protein ENBRE01_0629 [Enteropsectra breve]
MENFDFRETKGTITLVFYTKPGSNEAQEIKLIDETTVEANGQQIKLYKPVRDLQTKIFAKYVEAQMTKEKSESWYSYNGKKSDVAPKMSPYENLETPSQADQDMMEVIQNIYKNGNDEVKKAMDKSFLESKGTVLSTDWSKVEKRDFQNEKSCEK